MKVVHKKHNTSRIVDNGSKPLFSWGKYVNNTHINIKRQRELWYKEPNGVVMIDFITYLPYTATLWQTYFKWKWSRL